jgi:glutamate synthase domain-containing protein 2/ferredoxin
MANRSDMLVLNASVQRGYPIPRYRVTIDDACIKCGLCVEECPRGVFHYPDGLNRLPQPNSYRCDELECANSGEKGVDDAGRKTDGKPLCLRVCPVEAIQIAPHPSYTTFGDRRWTSDLLTATWYEAENAKTPKNVEYRIGNSGGGFDLMRFSFQDEANAREISTDQLAAIDLSLSLNRRDNRQSITLPFPWYGGGMSFGSVGLSTMLSRAMAAAELGTFSSTGEGGFPNELALFKDNMITQIATGLFGVREETLQWARILEFKYAQGAKPGLGGHLLADKVTPTVADLREAVAWRSLFSPFPFHSVYSVEDHKKHVDWVRNVNPRALISVKVSTPEDIDMVAVGSYYAGAHIIHIDGGYGGTGAAPEIAKKNIAMPIEYAIRRAHQFLEKEGIRDQVVLMASGGVRTPYDVAKAIALGADGCVIGTAELVALHCVRCGNCESGRGCPWGIASTDRTLGQLIEVQRGARQIINMYTVWQNELRLILARLGMKSIHELRGRTDVLRMTGAD